MQPGGTPLLAVEAVVLDTETTGLDTARARMVQIGGVRIAAGRLVEGSAFERLVHPGEPIPATATRIHGIDDAAVRSAPRFAAVAGDLEAFVGDALVIGHSIGFDLAILKRESERAGRPWRRPRALDTRLLGRIAQPDLPDVSLEILAGSLGLEIAGRHTALGDAEATARIFLALVPRLREKGIRTIAEAEAACRRLTDAMEAQHRAGWETGEGAVVDAERALARIDSYPYRHRVTDVMSAPPRTIAPSASLADALRAMVDARVSSLFVVPDGAGDPPPVAALAIVTERDVMRALAAGGAAALERPVATAASSPVASVPADAFVYRAMGRMDRLGIRHLGAVDEAGRLVGALSARDLLRLRAGMAVVLGDALDTAPDAPALALAFARLPELAGGLVAETVPIRDTVAVVSREIGALTRRAAILAEAGMVASGLGPAPCGHAVLVLGSGGRGDSLLAADQDNAVISERGEPDGPEDIWFAAYGARFAAILDEAGLPFCKGGVMARNPPWRGSLATWRARIDGWVRRSRGEDLLAVDIFFDLRAVHGDGAMAREILDHAYTAGGAALPFLKLLAAELEGWSPPLRVFGGFRTDDGRLDLKLGGFLPVVTAARVLSIRHGVVRRGTRERIDGLRARGVGQDGDLARMTEAYDLLQRLVLDQQLRDLKAGVRLGNAVEVSRLSREDRAALKDALAHLGNVPRMTRDLLF
jgi:DNA polymerase-3 subunit epsilon/CBS domain-containing protein